jgi:DNA-binding response OmpR family regulator
MKSIAVVEDDKSTNDKLRSLLETISDVQVEQAFDMEGAEALIGGQRFDLVILDIELGQGPREKHAGLKLLSQLSGWGCPTIVVSGMPEANLQSVALSLSAYDFISKPISELDFIRKAEHALAWKVQPDTSSADPERMWPAGLAVNPDRKPQLLWKGHEVPLTLTELGIVHCLADARGQVVEWGKLANHMKTAHSPSAIATHITAIRKKFIDIDPSFDCIEPEPGKGYAWKNEA